MSEPKTVQAIVIGIGHDPHPRPVTADLAEIRTLVDEGFVTTIELPDHQAIAWCDEDGYAKALPANLPAAVLLRALGWTGAGTLVGTFVITGWQRGNFADLPESVYRIWVELLGTWDPPEDT